MHRGVQAFPDWQALEQFPRNDEQRCGERAGCRAQTVSHPASWSRVHGQFLFALRLIVELWSIRLEEECTSRERDTV
jgi:hypothetical protein